MSRTWINTLLKLKSGGGLTNSVTDGLSVSKVLGTEAGLTTNFTSSTAGTYDETITVGFQPSVIILRYWIEGYVQADSIYGQSGDAFFKGTVLKTKKILWQFRGGNENPTSNETIAFYGYGTNATSPTVGSSAGTGGQITLSIASVSATGFVLRKVKGGSGAASAKISYECYE